nr:MAG TPA: hypothetical protein [Caudoviricetes sp.]
MIIYYAKVSHMSIYKIAFLQLFLLHFCIISVIMYSERRCEKCRKLANE